MNPHQTGGRGTPDPTADSLWVSSGVGVDGIWQLLGVPPLDGYQPAAITAVLVATDHHGRIARCPVYGQTAAAGLSEPVEVANAITLLHQWRRRQRRST